MSTVIPQALSLGSKNLYEVLFANVFANGHKALPGDVRAYCLAKVYRCGPQLEGAIELLLNLGILSISDEFLVPDFDFVRSLQTTQVGLALGSRLVDKLTSAKELDLVFPVGSLTWSERQEEINLHVSQIPMRSISVITLLRDLELVVESEDAAVILRIEPPFSSRLRTAAASASGVRPKRRSLSPEELKRIQEARSDQGAKAEEFVLVLERNRLTPHPQLEMIRRVSLDDTAAGFDIESFEGQRSFFPDRFIEVKSFSGKEHFFWSQGEIEVARELGERYFLYLVDMQKIAEAEYRPEIIPNPSRFLFAENCAWACASVGFEFVKNLG
jgi:hypothetical protein